MSPFSRRLSAPLSPDRFQLGAVGVLFVPEAGRAPV